MRGLDLFSGIGVASLAMRAAGIEVVAHAEIEPFPCKVLAHRFPGVPNLGDVSRITREQIEDLGEIDVVSFGSPCQDWSVAGKRLGLEGHRSSLFHEAVRIVRHASPRFAVFENVPGLFSAAGGWDFAAVLDEMAESGAMDIAWSVLDAQWFGVPQRRRRIFLVADFRGESAGEILSISEGVFRDTAPSREAGEEAAGGSGDGFAFALRGRDEGARVEVSGDRTSSIRGEGGSGRDYVALPEVAGGQPTRYGKGVNTTADDGAIVPVAFNWRENIGPKQPYSPPLGTLDDVAVAFTESDHQVFTSDNVGSLTSGGGKPGQGYPAVAFHTANSNMQGPISKEETMWTVEPHPSQSRHAIQKGMAVRRLTPLECERLQGVPDGWTDIPGASDSARYRALGNAWAYPVGAWVMKGITGVER